MASKLTMRYLDHNSEASSFSVPGVDLTAANLIAQQALMAALVAATGGIIIGTLNRETVLLSDTLISAVPATNPFAQRETKWLVTWVDTVTDEVHQSEIPTADLAELVPNGGTLNVAAASAGEDFVNAFEAFVRGNGVNTVQVAEIRHVGRNL